MFQLDGFHLSRACGRGYGKQIGAAIYDDDTLPEQRRLCASALMSSAPPSQTADGTAETESTWSPTWSHGVDWRNRDTQRSAGRAEPGDHGVQRGQAH